MKSPMPPRTYSVDEIREGARKCLTAFGWFIAISDEEKRLPYVAIADVIGMKGQPVCFFAVATVEDIRKLSDFLGYPFYHNPARFYYKVTTD